MIAALGLVLGASAEASAVRKAKIGHGLTLTGLTHNERMLVRPTRLIDPLPPTDPDGFDQPPTGMRHVAVKVTLKNTGRQSYSDSPDNGAIVVTRSGRTISSTILSAGQCMTSASLLVPRRQVRRVCIAFDVPNGVHLRYFEFTLDSGFADQTGEWTLRTTKRPQTAGALRVSL